MSVTQADLDALDRMIASGVVSTTYDGKRIEYRTMKELREARAALAAQLAISSGRAPITGYNPAYCKGV